MFLHPHDIFCCCIENRTTLWAISRIGHLFWLESVMFVKRFFLKNIFKLMSINSAQKVFSFHYTWARYMLRPKRCIELLWIRTKIKFITLFDQLLYFGLCFDLVLIDSEKILILWNLDALHRTAVKNCLFCWTSRYVNASTWSIVQNLLKSK